MKSVIVVILAILGVSNSLLCQRGFNGSAIIGLNASQLDGDALVGYNKLGLSAGVKVDFLLGEKLAGNVEVLYSQRGSSERLFERSDLYDHTNLNYFELPVYLSYGDWYIQEEGYYKMRAHFGFSYAALISTSGMTDLYDITLLSKNDISYLIGATYSFNPHWALTLRYTRALNKLLEQSSLKTGYLLGYFWTLRTEYTF